MAAEAFIKFRDPSKDIGSTYWLNAGCGDGIEAAHFKPLGRWPNGTHTHTQRERESERGCTYCGGVSHTHTHTSAAGVKKAIGLDYTQDMLDMAAKLNYYEKTIQHDLNNPLTFLPDSTFGLVTCLGVLTYIKPDSGVLKEFCRVTKPGGLIIMTHRVRAGPTRTNEADLCTCVCVCGCASG